MCFSATANFTGSGVLAALGIATLTRVRHRGELLLAAMPTLFAVHQFIEGFVWLGLDGVLSKTVLHSMAAAYVLYAQGLLPFVLPLGVLLFEPSARRRRWIAAFCALGALTTLYVLWALIAYPLYVHIDRHSIVYINHWTVRRFVAIPYIVATCGALLVSSVPSLVVLGAVNLAGLLLVAAVARYAFTSIWCAYAAVASVILLWYFWRGDRTRATERDPAAR